MNQCENIPVKVLPEREFAKIRRRLCEIANFKWPTIQGCELTKDAFHGTS
jgi:hypothetical protein